MRARTINHTIIREYGFNKPDRGNDAFWGGAADETALAMLVVFFENNTLKGNQINVLSNAQIVPDSKMLSGTI
jgi:hypothetical protein